MTESTIEMITAGRVTTGDIARALDGLVPETHRVVLFGSRTTGNASPRSDWDIGLVGPSAVDGALLERMREALDRLPTLRRFDVVDLFTMAPGLRDRTLGEGVPQAQRNSGRLVVGGQRPGEVAIEIIRQLDRQDPPAPA